MKLLLIQLSIIVFNSVLAQQSERKPISQRIQKKAPSVVKEKNTPDCRKNQKDNQLRTF